MSNTNTSACRTQSSIEEFSFVYIHFGSILFAFVLMFFFMSYVFAPVNLKNIMRHHSTISSFCANPRRWSSRFLIFITFLLGSNVSCILIEEHNSNTDGDWRVYIQIASALLLMLIGFFYTWGDGRIKNLNYSIGKYSVPITFSSVVHATASLGFFFVVPIINISFSSEYISNSKNGRFLFVLDILSLIVLATFMSIQITVNAYIMFVQDKPKPNKKKPIPRSVSEEFNQFGVLTEEDMECIDRMLREEEEQAQREEKENYVEKEMITTNLLNKTTSQDRHRVLLKVKDYINKNLLERIVFYKEELSDYQFGIIEVPDRPRIIQRLFVISFLAEFLMVFLVVTSTVFGSIKRNDNLEWFK